MKKYFLSLLLLIAFCNSKALSQLSYCLIEISHRNQTDTVPAYLASLNLELFKNKPVDSFLAKIPAGYIKMKIYGGDNPKIARKMFISYPNDVFIKIIVDEFQYMNPRSESRTWDINLFRKEKIN